MHDPNTTHYQRLTVAEMQCNPYGGLLEITMSVCGDSYMWAFYTVAAWAVLTILLVYCFVPYGQSE
jgi:bacteriorhodopsin